jgi:multiple sugar transport system substrate-binding protein/raffinose/stachyose/melibiose transport system substrate-binding protein
MTRILLRLLPLLLLLPWVIACSNNHEEHQGAVQTGSRSTITALIWAPDWPDEMQTIVTEFTKTHPQIRVELQFMIGNSVEENLKPKVASKKLPDLMSVNPNAYAADLADQGLLAEVGHTKVWNNMLDSLKADWTASHGTHYGISGGVAATLIYYNQGIFKKAGIKKLPTNFDEFLRVCQQLKSAGFVPIMWNGGFPNMLGNGPFSFGFANNIVAREPTWKQGLGDGSLDLNTPAMADIFDKIRLIAQRGYVQPDYMNTNYDAGIKLFTEGKTAMAFHGTWAAGLLMNAQGFQTGVFMPPWNKAGAQVVPIVGNETGFAVSESGNKAAAIEFLEYLFSKGFSTYQNKRQNIPPLKQVEGPVVANDQILDYVKKAQSFPVTASPYYSFLPATAIEMLHPLMQEVLLGKTSPKIAAKEFDQAIKLAAQHNIK